MDLVTSHIDKSLLPQHIAIIMDGNGRWAQKTGKPRVFGHRNGVKAVREVTEGAAEIGIKYLTLYAFSKENWSRPSFEVNTLMNLFVQTVGTELDTLNRNNIRLEAIGDIESLPAKTAKSLKGAVESTKNNDRMTLILALNYSSRWEITEAIKAITEDRLRGLITNTENITEDLVSDYLMTKNYPDPELMIRTSGEQRISNYLLWQLSYAELLFSEILWPDFTKQDLFDAIATYQMRERRFGKTGEQIKNKAI